MKEPYSKHKDRDPQGTVDSIVRMLVQAGLDTEMRWTSHPFEGLCSNLRYAKCLRTMRGV